MGSVMFTYAFVFHVLPTLYLSRMSTIIKPKQITSSTDVMKVWGPVLTIFLLRWKSALKSSIIVT